MNYRLLYEFVEWANSDTKLSFRHYLKGKYTTLILAAQAIKNHHQTGDEVLKAIALLNDKGYSFRVYQSIKTENNGHT